MLVLHYQGRRVQWEGFLAGVLVLLMVLSDMGVAAVLEAGCSWEDVEMVVCAFLVFEMGVRGIRRWIGEEEGDE